VSAATSAVESLCVNVIRGLAMDMVQSANSGHPGMPMGAAATAFALWTRHLRHDPKDPAWFDRDRFVLSAGHGSALLYALLHLSGYDLPLSELREFRQWGSRTPGHPENALTPGVEMATGPLGQGFATAVGMAIAERYLAALFNRPGHEIVDHRTYVLCSDGDLMEGVAQEAASLAGHLRLGKLVVLYDDNGVTIDGPTSDAFTEDTAAKFRAMGWRTLSAGGMDPATVDAAIAEARRDQSRPALVLCRTVIGYGSPNRAGTSKAHGAPLGEEELRLAKAALGLPDEPFWVPEEARRLFEAAAAEGAKAHAAWRREMDAYEAAHPEEAATLAAMIEGRVAPALREALPVFEGAISTRAASHKVLNAIAPRAPGLIGGAADLAESVLTRIEASSLHGPAAPHGRNVAFGVREHAMAAAVNGVTLHGGLRGYGGTFLVFSDYMRPALRLAALMECPSVFLFSHDSVGLGEDGPTHQPVEHLMSLRAIPNLNVMRPADGNETAACWLLALESERAPCALVLSRQALPALTPAAPAAHPARRGAYVLAEPPVPPRVALIATGSEAQVAMAARDILSAEGVPARVVSMPSWFLFERQEAAYRREVLPEGLPAVSVEAGATLGWARYAAASVGIDRFGASAPGPVVLRELGVTPEAVAEAARRLLRRRLPE
jgi:transketolase